MKPLQGFHLAKLFGIRVKQKYESGFHNPIWEIDNITGFCGICNGGANDCGCFVETSNGLNDVGIQLSTSNNKNYYLVIKK